MKMLSESCRSIAAAIALAGCQSVAPPTTTLSAVKQMSVGDTTLAYIDEGHGTPLVFVHGAMSDHRIWEAQRQAFSKTHRFIAMDQRYFGTAPWPDDGVKLSAAAQTDDLAAFIRGLGIGPVHLVGWSMSGASTLGVAARHPELVRSVFIYEGGSTGAVVDVDEMKELSADRAAMFAPAGAALKAGDQAAAVRLALDGVDATPDTFAMLPPAAQPVALQNARTLRPSFANVPSPPITCAQLGGIQRPVSFARGSLTRPYYRILTEATARCIPGAKVLVAPGQRHRWPQTDPVGFNYAVATFVTPVKP